MKLFPVRMQNGHLFAPACLAVLAGGLVLLLAACGTNVAKQSSRAAGTDQAEQSEPAKPAGPAAATDGAEKSDRADQATRAEGKDSHLEVVLINGGGRPGLNFLSHLLHVRELRSLLLHSGVDPADIAIFSSDGGSTEADLAVRAPQAEADFWLLRGTRLGSSLRNPVTYENSIVKGSVLRPATRPALRKWFEGAAQRLEAGDTLLLYVTDHGKKNKDDTSNNDITMWGKDESISVNELRELVELLDPGVQVVTLMSQCFSGAFANLMYAGAADGLPGGNVCGFFSSTAERPAYGCYPENRDKDNVGHSFRFIESLRVSPEFPAAHSRVLVSDRTPDVPLRSSDVYLATLLEAAADERDLELDELVDELLLEAWRDKGAWEPEIRLLDRIGQAFGYFSPRSLSELKEQSTLLPEVSQQFKSFNKAWKSALQSLTAENLKRFVRDNPDWKERLSDTAVASLDTGGRRGLTEALLLDLVAYTRADTRTSERLDLLREKAEATKAARYRMQVRIGVVLRMEAVLTSIAGRVYIANHAPEPQRQAYAQLAACEDFSLPGRAGASTPPVVPEPFPSYDEELKLAKAALPGWMGIQFKQASKKRREKHGFAPGAVSVMRVYPDSPAEEAGLKVGDIILGPPDALFTESHQVREWVMTAPIGRPEWLLVRRGNEDLRLSLTPDPYPLKWPALPGPPKVGSAAPLLKKLETYRGRVPVKLASGEPHLLFFWATWCAPCKKALPEIVAFEKERGIQVIAITDELSEVLDEFFEDYEGPFPEAVAIDEFRRSFLDYGVSGTPSFVYVDGSGKLLSMSTGYRPDQGLGIEGWSWAGSQ